MIRLQKVSLPAPNFSRPKPLLMIDLSIRKLQAIGSSARQRVPRVDDIEGDLKVDFSSGIHLKPLPSSELEAIAATATAAVSETQV